MLNHENIAVIDGQIQELYEKIKSEINNRSDGNENINEGEQPNLENIGQLADELFTFYTGTLKELRKKLYLISKEKVELNEEQEIELQNSINTTNASILMAFNNLYEHITNGTSLSEKNFIFLDNFAEEMKQGKRDLKKLRRGYCSRGFCCFVGGVCCVVVVTPILLSLLSAAGFALPLISSQDQEFYKYVHNNTINCSDFAKFVTERDIELENSMTFPLWLPSVMRDLSGNLFYEKLCDFANFLATHGNKIDPVKMFFALFNAIDMPIDAGIIFSMPILMICGFTIPVALIIACICQCMFNNELMSLGFSNTETEQVEQLKDTMDDLDIQDDEIEDEQKENVTDFFLTEKESGKLNEDQTEKTSLLSGEKSSINYTK
jgi:hypothetical protein